MNRRPLTLTVLLFLIACPHAFPEGPPTDWQKDLVAWRAELAKELQAPDGWLTLAGLDWLHEGDNGFGSAAGNPLRIEAPVAPHLGVLHLNHNAVTLLPPPGGFPKELALNGQAAKTQALNSEEKPDVLSDGTWSMIVIHRGDRFALRLKNSRSPTLLDFHGLKWYAPEMKYRIAARWVPYTPPRMMKIPTVVGTTVQLPAPGAAEFVIDGRTVRLEPVLESLPDKELFFIVRDRTSQTTTYGAGRFLYTDFPDHGLTQPGTIWLDFNRLQNPPCAYTPYATCPLPPAQNRLNVALPAGEQRYH